MVSWWPGEGNANDVLGINNGTLFNGVTFAPGIVGEAFSFNGISSYVRIADNPSLHFTNAMTIEAWVYLTSLGTYQNVVTKWDWPVANAQKSFTTSVQPDGTIGLGVCNDGSCSQGAGGGSATVLSTNSLQVSQWTHFAATYDGSNLRIYVNGVCQNQTAYNKGLFPGTNDLLIGAALVNGGQVLSPFAGLIDEPSVYSRALSAAEIQGIYLAGSAGKCEPAPTPHAATATATVVSGFVVGATITDGGWGYTNTPGVTIIGGGGSGAQAVAVVSNGVVIAVNVLDAGSGYTNTPVIVIAPPFIPQPAIAIGTASLLSFTNLAVGTNYQLQVFSNNTWSNLDGAFTAAGSTFTQYVSGTAGPNGYRLASTPVPSQAYATAQVLNGFVVGATVTSGGSGYGSNVIVSIVGGGGSNATAIAKVSGGVVTGLTITDAGIGYTITPTIIIAPPPANAVWPMVMQAVELDLGSLSPYDNYQLEFAPVLGGAWSNLGGLFTPTATTSTQYVNVSGNAGFFRVRHVP